MGAQRRLVMREITAKEMEFIGGGVDRPHDVVPNAQSEYGRLTNDLTNMFGRWGDRLGSAVYDWFH